MSTFFYQTYYAFNLSILLRKKCKNIKCSELRTVFKCSKNIIYNIFILNLI